MARFSNPLDHVSVAAPCSANWDQMMGNDRARFCAQCNLNVYNLSDMTKAEAESLIAGSEGRLCIRFYRRADGSILTRNCPVGLQAIRRRLSYVRKAITSAVLGFLAGFGVYEGISGLSAFYEDRRHPLMGEMVSPAQPIQLSPPAPTAIVGKMRVNPEASQGKQSGSSHR